MNTEGQDMETYQIFLVPKCNNKITEELDLKACNDSVTPNIRKKTNGIFGL